MTAKKIIIAIGGGKGGIGKSVICTNLAAGLALAGQEVILADMDFGATNLHAFLGISHPRNGFQDLIRFEGEDPETLLLGTGVNNLKFLSGAGDHIGGANIDKDQNDKIVSLIQRLDAEVIVLDLGPGTNFNTIEFFNLAGRGVVLVTPEMPSVMNAFSFLKASLFQRLSHEFKDQSELHQMVDHSRPPEPGKEIFTVEQLRDRVKEIAPEYEDRLSSVIESCKPALIVNRVRKKKDLLVAENLIQLARKYLELELDLLGYLIESDRVRNSVDEMIPFLIKDPQSKPSENIQNILGALTHTRLHLYKKGGVIYVSKQVSLTSGWNA